MAIRKVRAGTFGDDNCSLQCLEQGEALLKCIKRSGVKDLQFRTNPVVLTLNTPPAPNSPICKAFNREY